MNTIAPVPNRVQWGLGGPVRLLASGNRRPSCSTLLTVQEDPRVAGHGTGLPSPQCLTLKLKPPPNCPKCCPSCRRSLRSRAVQNAPARRGRLPARGPEAQGRCLGNDHYNYCLLYSFSHWKPRTQNPFPEKSRGSLVLLGPGAGRAAAREVHTCCLSLPPFSSAHFISPFPSGRTL